MIDYVRTSRDGFGVEPVCVVLAERGVQIAPGTFDAYAARGFGPTEAERDGAYAANEIFDVWVKNRRLYGRRKRWKAAIRAQHEWGRDRVEWLMKIAGIEGVRRGPGKSVATERDDTAIRHPDHIKW